MKNYDFSFNIDVVFCVDCTESMKKYMDSIKEYILGYCDNLKRVMWGERKVVGKFRVRVIAFKDYFVDGAEAIRVTDFFNLPEDIEAFERCVRSLEANGVSRGNLKSGLEALAYAIRSKWDMKKPNCRNVIIVWSDGGTHPLGYGSLYKAYPSGMAVSFDELSEWWGEGNLGLAGGYSKRLFLFAPIENDWNIISSKWENVLHYPTPALDEVTDLEHPQILACVANDL